MNFESNNDFNKINKLLNFNKIPSPLESIKYGSGNLRIKRDDLLDLGCSKQRSIPLMIFEYLNKGNKNFTISSSGNAALVSAYVSLHSDQINSLKIFLSDKISDYKIEKFIKHLNFDISKEEFRNNFKIKNIEFILCDNPKQRAFLLQKEGYVNLRGSTEDTGIKGFKTLGYEIADQTYGKVDAIFIPSSSGSTAIGLYEGLKEKGLNPQIHIVQTTRVFTLLKRLIDEDFEKEADHPAEAISDVIGYRRFQIENVISESGGLGWIIDKEEVIKAKSEFLDEFNITVSYDSALSFAAYKKALESGLKFENPLIVFTG